MPIEEPPQPQSNLLAAAHLIHIVGFESNEITDAERKEAKAQLMQQIKDDKMAPLLQHLQQTLPKQFSASADSALLTQLQADNKKTESELQTAIEEAKSGLGESEVRDAQWKLTQHYSRIGDKASTLTAAQICFDQTQGTASRIDVVFLLIRLALAFKDTVLLDEQIARCKSLVEKGGDWERKNLLSVYEATHLLTKRQLPEAARLFVSSISTFTATELYSYKQFVFYTILLALSSLPRADIKKNILEQSDVLSVIDSLPHVRQYAESLYKGEYAKFFVELSEIITAAAHDEYLAPHLVHYVRNVRCHTYKQYLAPFKQATLASTAKTFGISEEFAESELYRLISSGRLSARIDGEQRVIVTLRPDNKSHQYEQLIETGDSLLQRMQKINKIISY